MSKPVSLLNEKRSGVGHFNFSRGRSIRQLCSLHLFNLLISPILENSNVKSIFNVKDTKFCYMKKDFEYIKVSLALFLHYQQINTKLLFLSALLSNREAWKHHQK